MAEASNTTPDTGETSRYFCHQCSSEITPNIPDYTCPQCNSGFIEAIEDTPHSTADDVDAQHFTQLLGQQFAGLFPPMMRIPVGQMPSSDSSTSNGGVPNAPGVFIAPRMTIASGQGNLALQGFLEHLLGGLTGNTTIHINSSEGGPSRMGPTPFTTFLNLHGNPGDYAWGNTGLDNIITQLLNQMEGSGPPPADKKQIDSLPVVTVTPVEVAKSMQCSVCMEDLKEGEQMRKMPCSHLFHNDCIIPWLELHATCPVCRKDMNGENTQLPAEPMPSSEHAYNGYESIDEFD